MTFINFNSEIHSKRFPKILFIRYFLVMIFLSLLVQFLVVSYYAPSIQVRYFISSLIVYCSTYFFYRIKLPLFNSYKYNLPIAFSSKTIINFLNIFFLSLISYYSLGRFLISFGYSKTLYEASVILQSSSEKGFITRIFTANMPFGLASGYIIGCLLIYLLLGSQIKSQKFKLIYLVSFLGSIIYLGFGGGINNIISIILPIIFLIGFRLLIYFLRLIFYLKVNKKIIYLPFILLIFAQIFLLLNFFSKSKGYNSFLEILQIYFGLVFDYQVQIYDYVIANGTSGSGGLASLLPINIFEIGIDSLSKYKEYAAPFLEKGVWMGLLGKHLIEFGPVFQYFATFISVGLFTISLRLFIISLCGKEIGFYLLPLLLFNSVSTCWISEPWTSIFVYIFTILSTYIIYSIFCIYQNKKLRLIRFK